MNLSFPPPPHFWGVRVNPGLWPFLWKYMQSLHFSLIPRAMLLKDFTSGSSNMLDWSRVRSHWASSPLCWNLVDSLSLHTIKRGPKGFFPNQYLCYLNARIWDFRAKWGQDLGLKACTECGKVVCWKQPPGSLDWGKIFGLGYMLKEPYLVPSIKTGIQKQEPALFSTC